MIEKSLSSAIPRGALFVAIALGSMVAPQPTRATTAATAFEITLQTAVLLTIAGPDAPRPPAAVVASIHRDGLWIHVLITPATAPGFTSVSVTGSSRAAHPSAINAPPRNHGEARLCDHRAIWVTAIST